MDYWEEVLNEVLQRKNMLASGNYSIPAVTQNDYYRSQKIANRYYYLGEQYPDVYFTRREGECLYQLLNGCTISKTASRLGLSSRTVEFYVKNMKMKVGVATKAEFLAAMVVTPIKATLARDFAEVDYEESSE